jgi:hypothetical protein
LKIEDDESDTSLTREINNLKEEIPSSDNEVILILNKQIYFRHKNKY